MAEPLSFSDISFVCTRIPGANLGVGYYNEHTPAEYVDIAEWKSTLDVARKWLSEDLPSFRLKEDK
jgi:di/tripeptidase